MKKNQYVAVFIFLGIVSLIYAYLGDDTDSYAENVFADETRNMENAFHAFVTKLNKTYDYIQTEADTPINPKDSVALNQFFNALISKDQSLNSIVWVDNNLKIAFKKDGKSIIHAIDSGNVTGSVKWKRYKKGKFISSWQEHFEDKIDLSKWYSQLAKSKKGLFWKFPNQKDFQEDTFFIGRKFDNNNYIVLGYSVPELMKELNIEAETQGKHLFLGLPDGSYMDFTGNSPEIVSDTKTKDSVAAEILQIARQYENKKEPATFSFKYKDDVYWNYYKPIDPETGIKHFIYSAPESLLPVGVISKQNELLKWPGIIMLAIGLGMLFVDPKYFDLKKIKNPPLKELLKSDEGRKLEFKSSLRWDYRQEKVNPALENVILKTVAAFANTSGGTLLIGVNDDKEVVGLEKDFATLKKQNSDYYEIHLRNLLHKNFGVKNVSKFIRIAFEKMDGNEVCKVIVLQSDSPVYLKTKDKNGVEREKFYVRSGNSSQEIHSINEITDYINTHFKK